MINLPTCPLPSEKGWIQSCRPSPGPRAVRRKALVGEQVDRAIQPGRHLVCGHAPVPPEFRLCVASTVTSPVRKSDEGSGAPPGFAEHRLLPRRMEVVHACGRAALLVGEHAMRATSRVLRRALELLGVKGREATASKRLAALQYVASGKTTPTAESSVATISP